MTESRSGTAAPHVLPAGTRLNGIFEVERHIGSGGMGEIYRGYAIQTGDAVAIKIIRTEMAENEAALALFRKEASVLHNLLHEAIVRYYIFSIDPEIGRPYLVMEFVDGQALSDVLAAGPLSAADVLRLAARLASGLEAAHALGVIHRDISPDNVILPDGEVGRAKIIDFGIARAAAFGAAGTVIGGGFAGKYNYVSPEQLGLFDGTVTPRSDIYSLGLVLAEALLGRPLDMSGSQVEVIEKRRKVPNLERIEPRLRPFLASMLQPKPDDRPQSMAEVAEWAHDELEAIAPGQTTTTRLGARRSAPRKAAWSGRRRAAAWAAALAVFVIAGVGVSYGPYLLSGPTEDVADTPTLDPLALEAAEDSGEPDEPDIALVPLEETDPASAEAQPAVPAAATEPEPAQSALAPEALAPIETPDPPQAEAEPDFPPPEVEPERPEAETALVEPPAPVEELEEQEDEIAALVAPPAPPEEAPPPVLGPEAEIAQYVRDFDAGRCVVMKPLDVGPQSAQVEAFGDSVEPFEVFDSRFRADMGFEAQIQLRLVTSDQCPAIDFLHDVARGDARQLQVALDSYAISPGDALSGRFGGDGDIATSRELALFVISADGQVHPITHWISPTGASNRFAMRLDGPDRDEAMPHLLLAIASDAPLTEIIEAGPALGDQFFDLLKEAMRAFGGDVEVGAAYFMFGG